MRTSLFLLPLLLTSPLAAQFEGTVAMTVSAREMGNESIDMKYHVKGDKVAIVMIAPASSGPMAGAEMRMLLDPAASTMTMLIPVAAEMAGMMGGAKGIKMVTDLSNLPAEAGKAPEGSVKKLGTSQTVAGRACDDYEVTTEGETFTMCLASGLGRFMFISGGGMGRGASVPKWARNLDGKFPLKITDKKGSATVTVTSITKGNVPESMFAIPADYRDMGGMMGGMGGRRNN